MRAPKKWQFTTKRCKKKAQGLADQLAEVQKDLKTIKEAQSQQAQKIAVAGTVPTADTSDNDRKPTPPAASGLTLRVQAKIRITKQKQK